MIFSMRDPFRGSTGQEKVTDRFQARLVFDTGLWQNRQEPSSSLSASQIALWEKPCALAPFLVHKDVDRPESKDQSLEMKDPYGVKPIHFQGSAAA
jgi:hypothetical protein